MLERYIKKNLPEPRKPRDTTYGFFRILTIGVLVVIGFLMLGESLNLFRFYVGNVSLDTIYPVIIILSTIILRNYKRVFGKIFGLFLFLLVFGGFFSVGIYTSLNQYSKSSFSQTIKNNVPKSSLVNFSVETFIGSINIAGGKQNSFVEGKYKSDRNLIIQNSLYSGMSYFSIEEEKDWNILQDYQTNLDLTVSKAQPISLYVKNLLGQHIIDMSNISRNQAKIHLGFADLNLILGKQIVSGNLLQIEDSVANIKIQIPEDVGVRLYSKRFIGYMVGELVKKGENYYESTNIDSAKKIVNIDVKSGIGLIDIVRLWE